MPSQSPARQRAATFCRDFGLSVPILLAPMAGACPPALSIAVAQAGGLGACGALLMRPEAIAAWASEVRAATNGGFQINLWIPDPPPARDVAAEAAVRAFLATWGPEVPASAADSGPPDFAAQCEAILEAGPSIVSSIMGVYPPAFVARLKERSIRWLATVTTVAEARAAVAAGADAVIAQGSEAGGHRGAFDAAAAERQNIGTFALVPAVADAVDVPVVAAGGIADARTIAAALTLGASAVQIGTGYLRTPEAGIAPAWADALGAAEPEQTITTRAFSGRLARSLATPYALAAGSPDAPAPRPYPIQRALTQPMREAANRANDIDRMQAWSGQAARLAQPRPAAELTRQLWDDARALLA